VSEEEVGIEIESLDFGGEVGRSIRNFPWSISEFSHAGGVVVSFRRIYRCGTHQNRQEWKDLKLNLCYNQLIEEKESPP